jgi:hypothetical protein
MVTLSLYYAGGGRLPNAIALYQEEEFRYNHSNDAVHLDGSATDEPG